MADVRIGDVWEYGPQTCLHGARVTILSRRERDGGWATTEVGGLGKNCWESDGTFALMTLVSRAQAADRSGCKPWCGLSYDNVRVPSHGVELDPRDKSLSDPAWCSKVCRDERRGPLTSPAPVVQVEAPKMTVKSGEGTEVADFMFATRCGDQLGPFKTRQEADGYGRLHQSVCEECRASDSASVQPKCIVCGAEAGAWVHSAGFPGTHEFVTVAREVVCPCKLDPPRADLCSLHSCGVRGCRIHLPHDHGMGVGHLVGPAQRIDPRETGPSAVASAPSRQRDTFADLCSEWELLPDVR